MVSCRIDANIGTVTVTGTVTTGDTASITVQNVNLSGGQKTTQYVVVGGDTTTTIATALKNAINADASLQAVGVQATSAANVLSIAPFTYTTGSSSGTETVAISNANRGSAAVTIGGTVTTGNTVTLTPHNPALSGGLRNITYTVIAGDTLTSISKALADLVNADSILKAIGIKVSNAATLAWSQSFSGNALLPTGSSLASATAIDGSSNTKTNGYAMSVNAASGSTLTYDLLGNMTSDGTSSYSWDAENRMIKIVYPGTNNFSTFVYDGLSRNVSIVETTAGSVTSTKQFVWAADSDKKRLYKACEERDASGVLTKKFFNRGQMNSTTKYFYDLDHLGSVREMTDNSGVIQAQYSFDPFGRISKLSEAVASDFGYAGYYLHARSGLGLTRTRFYSAILGRFISRDPIEENGGTNLYGYVLNNPISYIDPEGFEKISDREKCMRNCLRHAAAGAGVSAFLGNDEASGETTLILGVGVEIVELGVNIVTSIRKGRITGSLKESLSDDTPIDIMNDAMGIDTAGKQRPGPVSGGGFNQGVWQQIIDEITKNCKEQCKCKSDRVPK